MIMLNDLFQGIHTTMQMLLELMHSRHFLLEELYVFSCDYTSN